MRGVASPEAINENIYVVVFPFVAIIPKGLFISVVFNDLDKSLSLLLPASCRLVPRK